MTDPRTILDGPAIEAAQLADWRPLFGRLTARFGTGDFASGLALVTRIAAAAEAANHHPDLELTCPSVTVRLTSHDVGGITSRDLDLARTISELAAEAGATAQTTDLAAVELALDTEDATAIRPFWAAVLGLQIADDSGDLVDPAGQVPTVWFQHSDSGAGQVPQRWHLDLRVPPEQVQPRIDAALAAGGTLVTDEHAPQFWVLADAQGNQVCLTTWQGRTTA
jgi:4a-hydroxytetrahydrobiopterin dehydratase